MDALRFIEQDVPADFGLGTWNSWLVLTAKIFLAIAQKQLKLGVHSWLSNLATKMKL